MLLLHYAFTLLLRYLIILNINNCHIYGQITLCITLSSASEEFRTRPCKRKGNATTSIRLLVKSRAIKVSFFGKALASSIQPSLPKPFQDKSKRRNPWFSCNVEGTCDSHVVR